MGDKMKLSRISLFFFVFNYFYLFFRLYLFPFFFNQYKSIAYIYFIILIILLIILILIIPKKLFTLNNFYSNTKFKYLYYLYVLIRIGISIYLCSLLLSETFFINNNIILLSLGLFVGIIILSKSNNKDIIDISTFFYILIFIITLFSLLDITNLDYSLLKSKLYYEFNIAQILIIIPIIIDIIVLITTNNHNIQLSKLNIIIPLVLSVILVVFEYYVLILSSGENLFLNYSYVGFISLSIQKLSILVGNLSFLYILTIIISIIFKTSYLLSSFRINKINNKIIIFESIIMAITFLFFYFLKIQIIEGLKFQIYYLIFGSLYLIFIIKEQINVRRHNKK